ncbi:hypothetical protein HME9304_00914 [Flagellimonas maritima]|uniref:Uncharacterized protein n=1 Tax=Flagellimonas maritima TaxID=1383885 RepID=A0A2Z4LQ30_9FLAO|nr:hypothetical protein [Allomuricauda aurantiaca]AWX43916.1 hypothetical protein HME9304_00914 [Allomuricauda aurantiaca]
MNKIPSIQFFPREIKVLIALFLIVVSTGFLSALQFVNLTTDGNPKGIEENYLGNEEDLEAAEMKFAKSERQILNIVHTHVLAMGMLFFILALLISTTPIKSFWRSFLLIEPLISVLLTFGGIYLLFKGILWMKYVIMVSGLLMTFSFIVSVLVILFWLYKKTDKIP